MPRRVLPIGPAADGYTYFSCPGTSYVTVQVFNNGIDIGYGEGYPAANYLGQDEYISQAAALYPRACDEIRFKNHVAGKIALVQITAQGTADLPGDTPLGISIDPTFVTINPDGSTSITFDNATFNNATINTATINNETVVGSNITNLMVALLQLFTGSTLPPAAASEIQWIRPSDSAVTADLFSTEVTIGNVFDILRLLAIAAAPTPNAIAELGAQSAFGTALLEVGAGAAGASITTSIPGASPATIQDNNSNSSFLQGGSSQKSVAGIATCTFTGGALSAATPISLPGASGFVQGVATPIFLVSSFFAGMALCQPNFAGGVNLYVVVAPGGGTPAAGATVSVSYIIWGN